MKQEASSKYARRVTVRFRPEEFKRLQRHCKSTTYRKLREYDQKVLFNKPVVVNHRNQSADDILAGIIQLKAALNILLKHHHKSHQPIYLIKTSSR